MWTACVVNRLSWWLYHITNDGYPADDGISPTVKCTKCSVWGHRHCNDQSGYICWRCDRTTSSSYSDDNFGTAVKPPISLIRLQAVMAYADLSPAELRAKGIEEHIILSIEKYRRQIQPNANSDPPTLVCTNCQTAETRLSPEGQPVCAFFRHPDVFSLIVLTTMFLGNTCGLFYVSVSDACGLWQ